ncbi:MAG: hypothetical protein DME15_03160 [Candidatus Rokuibacteriota bacterium]|nr:MAG: hypothetical protein DME15_03160 [Candidatus Rokubacteria bacterium]
MTSATLQEGKTTTIVNLAITMAQSGQRTLLVGSNMRRPSIHRFFGIEREPGLSDILVGSVQWRDCIRTVADILMGRFEMEDIMSAPGLDNLHIIEAGPIPANPSELLSTPAMTAFLQAVREEYDIVLIDTPPVLPVTDSAIVASQTDGVILVYQAGKVGRLVLKRAKVHIENVGGKVWGVVLNDVKSEIAGYAYTHYYTHYYGEETVVDARKEQLQRVGGFFRKLFRRGRGKETTIAERPAEVAGAYAPAAAEPARARRGPRRGLLLALLVVLAGAAVAGLFVWRAGWLTSDLGPRQLLRQRLAAPRPPAPAPASAAPPPLVAPAPPPVAPESVAAAPAPVAPAPAPVAPAPAPVAPAPAPESVAPAAAAQAPGPPPAPEVQAPAAPPPAAAAARFALELGPFTKREDVERVELQLSRAGYATVRLRQRDTGAAVYAVLIEQVPSAREAQAVVATLREQGLGDAMVLGDGEPRGVRVGAPLPLRGAVQLAERVRAAGYRVRVALQPGEALTFTLRLGSFATSEEGQVTSQELTRAGLANRVVRVK